METPHPDRRPFVIAICATILPKPVIPLVANSCIPVCAASPKMSKFPVPRVGEEPVRRQGTHNVGKSVVFMSVNRTEVEVPSGVCSMGLIPCWDPCVMDGK